MHLQAWKEKWEGSDDWDVRHWDELWPRLSEFAVRLRRAVARRFHDLLPFLKMCAFVHPCKHAEGILADDDFRVKLANVHGEGFGLAEGAGGRALQELAHRLRNLTKSLLLELSFVQRLPLMLLVGDAQKGQGWAPGDTNVTHNAQRQIMRSRQLCTVMAAERKGGEGEGMAGRKKRKRKRGRERGGDKKGEDRGRKKEGEKKTVQNLSTNI